MEDFVNFEIAKKLKKKGFSCEIPFAMYNEIGCIHLLTTAAPYNVCDSGFKYREYYDYEDFDENDFIAPTISQVLKWLREEKEIHICIDIANLGFFYVVKTFVWDNNHLIDDAYYVSDDFKSYEQAAIAGIEYVLDNLIG